MTFNFEQDYLADLQPVLVQLRRIEQHEAVSQILRCKEAGATGGEILSCICSTLRGVRRGKINNEAREAINDYLRRVGPGY